MKINIILEYEQMANIIVRITQNAELIIKFKYWDKWCENYTNI